MGRGGTRPYHGKLGKDDFHVVPDLIKKKEMGRGGTRPYHDKPGTKNTVVLTYANAQLNFQAGV
jgi:hypothetical protein